MAPRPAREDEPSMSASHTPYSARALLSSGRGQDDMACSRKSSPLWLALFEIDKASMGVIGDRGTDYTRLGLAYPRGVVPRWSVEGTCSLSSSGPRQVP